MPLDSLPPAPAPSAPPPRRAPSASSDEGQGFALPEDTSRQSQSEAVDERASDRDGGETTQTDQAQSTQSQTPVDGDTVIALAGGGPADSIDSAAGDAEVSTQAVKPAVDPEGDKGEAAPAQSKSDAEKAQDERASAQKPVPAADKQLASPTPEARTEAPAQAEPSQADRAQAEAGQSIKSDASSYSETSERADNTAPKADTQVQRTQDGVTPPAQTLQTGASQAAKPDVQASADTGVQAQDTSKDEGAQPVAGANAKSDGKSETQSGQAAQRSDTPVEPSAAQSSTLAQDKAQAQNQAQNPSQNQAQAQTEAQRQTETVQSAQQAAQTQGQPADPRPSLAAGQNAQPAQTPGEQARARQAEKAQSAKSASASEAGAGAPAPARQDNTAQPATGRLPSTPLPPALDPLQSAFGDPLMDAPLDIEGADVSLDLDADAVNTTRTDARADTLRSGAAQAQAAAGRFAPHTTQNLAAQIVRKFADGGRVFDIRMDPAELGRVDVRLELGPDNRVSAILSAERAETLAELQRSAKDLERALNEAGLDLSEDGLSFNLSDGSNPFEDAMGEEQPHPHRERSFTVQTDEAVITETPSEALYGFAVQGRAGVNLIA